MTTETSFSWNFDTGTLTEAAAGGPSLVQEPGVQGHGSGAYDVPPSASLSDEPATTSKKPSKRASVHFAVGESDRLASNRPEKVYTYHTCLFYSQ